MRQKCQQHVYNKSYIGGWLFQPKIVSLVKTQKYIVEKRDTKNNSIYTLIMYIKYILDQTYSTQHYFRQ